jgi:hypothetical protein
MVKIRGVMKGILVICAHVLVFNQAFAMWSASMFSSEATDRRAYQINSTIENFFNPFSTYGTIKVYVKTGETICVGTGIQGRTITNTAIKSTASAPEMGHWY